MKSRTLIALGAVSASTLVAHAGIVHHWGQPTGGFWNVGSNWDLGIVPSSGDGAVIPGIATFAVVVSVNHSIGLLDIQNENASLDIHSGKTMAINGNLLNNSGLIFVNSNNGNSATSLVFNTNTLLNGTGSVFLNRGASLARIQAGAGMTITQSPTHMIAGQGQVEAAVVNDGVIRANVTGLEMRLVTNSKTNNGTIEAVNDSRIDIAGITITQGVSGVVRGDGASSQVEFSLAGLTGGTLETINGAEVLISNSSTLDSVSFTGDLNLLSGKTLIVNNALVNDGLITVNSNQGNSATTMLFNHDMTLLGNGTVKLIRPGSLSRIQTAAGVTLTIPSTQTIEGFGQIEGAIVNDGLVQANVALTELILVSNNKTNNSLIEAANDSRIDITGITITQSAGGVVRADGAGSQIELNSAGLIGGTLETLNGAEVFISNTSTLDSVNFSGDLNLFNGKTLFVNNALTNDGLITINSNQGNSATTMVFNHSMELAGSGTVKLVRAGSLSRVQTASGVTLTIPATQTIEGFGDIEGVLINNGLIQSNVLASELRLVTNSKTNNSLIEAVNDTRVDITGITITQGVAGVIRADGVGSQIEMNSATITGGTLEAINGAEVFMSNSSTLDSVNFSGDLNLFNGKTLFVNNALTNDGLITINSNQGNSATTMVFNHDMTLAGNGTVKLTRAGSLSRIQTASGVTLTIPSTQTIEGFGNIEGVLINNGLIQSNVIANEIRMVSNSKANNAIIEAINDATIDIASITITQGPGGVIRADGTDSRVEMSNCNITGGNLETTNGADIVVQSTSTLEALNFSGILNLLNGQTLVMNDGVLNNGLMVINSNQGNSATTLLWNEAAMTLGGNGTIRLNRPGSLARIQSAGGNQGTLGSGQRLEGIGQIAINLINHGTIAPGMSIGTMNASQPIFFSSAANFEAEVDAASGDLLDSSSTVELHGTLDVLYTNGFAPTGFWARTIIEGSNITGEFDVVNVPPAGVGFVTRVINTGTELIVGQTCPSDTNLDGALDFFDVSKFLSDFAAMNPAADLNGDGVFNFFDVSVFLANYSGGCSI